MKKTGRDQGVFSKLLFDHPADVRTLYRPYWPLSTLS